MDNLNKIKFRKLIEDGKKFHYINNGKKRIYNTVCKTKELVKDKDKLLDVGGHPHLGQVIRLKNTLKFFAT